MAIFLALSGALWLPYGLWCFVHPSTVGRVAGVIAVTPTAIAEVRAMYGGLQVAVGTLALVGLARPGFRRGIVATLGVLTGGLGVARLIAVVLGASVSGYTAGALVVELGSVVWVATLLRR